jgi:hypothetical protein
MNIFLWILTGIFWAFFLLFIISLCKAAARADAWLDNLEDPDEH